MPFKGIGKSLKKAGKSIDKGAKKTFKPAVMKDIGKGIEKVAKDATSKNTFKTIGGGLSGAAGGIKDSFDNLINTAGSSITGLGDNLESTLSNPLLIIGGVVVVGGIAYVVMSNKK